MRAAFVSLLSSRASPDGFLGDVSRAPDRWERRVLALHDDGRAPSRVIREVPLGQREAPRDGALRPVLRRS